MVKDLGNNKLLNDEIIIELVFNAISGPSITFDGNIDLQNEDQIESIARDIIIIEPGFNTEVGTHFVARIDGSICGSSQQSGTANENIDIDDEVEFNIHLQPNPSNGLVNLEIEPFVSKLYEIIVFDSQGRCVFNLSKIEDSRIEIDLSQFGSGIYLLRVHDFKNDIVKSNKLIIEK